jgi:prolyl oligopeptidase
VNSTFLSLSLTGEPVRDLLHGIEVEDPFRWLEDQESPATRSFIRTEQETYHRYLDRHKELRSRIERRVTELLTVASVDLPVPDHRGGLVYLKREAEEEQKALYCHNEANGERLLISVAMLGRGSYTSLAILQVSPDGRYLAFGIRTGGEDVQEIRIYDLIEGRLLVDCLPRGFYRGLVFDDCQRGFYYVHEEATGPYSVRRAVRWHCFGPSQAHDEEVFYAGEGPGIRLILQGAMDGSSLGYTIASLQTVSKTCLLLHRFPLTHPPRKLLELTGATLGARVRGHSIDALTTYMAPLGRIVSFTSKVPDPNRWVEVIPQTDERLYGYERWKDTIVAHYLCGTSIKSLVYSSSSEILREIRYPSSGTTTLGQIDAPNNRLFYMHSDVSLPPRIYATDLNTGKSSLWWQQSATGSRTEMIVERHEYVSPDNAHIPITVIRPRDSSGVRSALLSAYGGGGASDNPRFSVFLTMLLEAGIVCATAHVRRGASGGRQPDVSTRKQSKQTSVDDVIAGATWMIESNYAAPNRLGFAGNSNGGLLALCAMTQQPHLFRAVMAIGPIADLTRFHLFGVARGFVADLGSPEDPEEFDALYRLSPYHRVRNDTHYPALLIISGDRDKRCDSLHARKMIAQLRDIAEPDFPILLDYTELRGHKPVLPLAERIKSLTDRLTFLISELGIPHLTEVRA